MRKIEGVMVFLMEPSGKFFVVREKSDKKPWIKNIGDCGLPTETIEPAEGIFEAAFRAASEEAGIVRNQVTMVVFLDNEKMIVNVDGEPVEVITNFCAMFVRERFELSSLTPTDPGDVAPVGWKSLKQMKKCTLRRDLAIDGRLQKYYKMAMSCKP